MFGEYQFCGKGKTDCKGFSFNKASLFYFLKFFVMFANSRYNVFALEFIASTFLPFCTIATAFYLFLILYLKCWNTLT